MRPDSWSWAGDPTGAATSCTTARRSCPPTTPRTGPGAWSNPGPPASSWSRTTAARTGSNPSSRPCTRTAPGTGPLRRVNASQGKRLRAQPVAMRYEQRRVCHVGSFPDLEDQLTTWIPEEDPTDSPDRLDAMVHGITHFMKKYDRSETNLISPHALKGLAQGEHPAIAARRRAQAQKAS